MEKIKLKYPLSEFKKVVHKWLYMENDEVIDIIVSTFIANQLDADPIWLIIIAPPSSTKTELLRAFMGHNKTYFISNITPQTLVSGTPKKKNIPETSLLPKLNDKLVILKDFTTILSMRSENQAEILAQLREAYDGQYSKTFGNGKEVNWKGRFGLLAACTPIYDSHYAVIGAMGERFLLFRTDNINGGKMGMQAQKIVGQENQMRFEIKMGLHKFINQFNEIKDVKFEKDDDVNMMIVSLACFVAYGRCPVQRDYRDKGCVMYQPAPEGPPRLVKQLMQIGMGLSMAYGQNEINGDVYRIIKKIGRDLIPAHRLTILRHLWDSKAFDYLESWEKTGDISDVLNTTTTTAKRNLEDLMVVGALNRKLGESEGGRPPYLWQLSPQMAELIGQSELFDE